MNEIHEANIFEKEVKHLKIRHKIRKRILKSKKKKTTFNIKVKVKVTMSLTLESLEMASLVEQTSKYENSTSYGSKVIVKVKPRRRTIKGDR